jgi:lipopolysaccharide transport system permease protein
MTKVASVEVNELVIEAGRTERQYWRDLWRYRELFYFLAWRDLLVRYKQTVVGVLWAFIKPILTILVLTVAFGKFGKISSQGVPFPLMVCCGTLPWLFFTSAISECGNSLVSSANLISKIYFPRLIIPASSVITSFVDFLISALILLAMAVWYRFVPSGNIIFLPLFVLLTIALSLGAGLWIAALMVEYRDVRFVLPFVVQFGLFISSVGIPSSEVHEKWRLLYSLNPMVGIIDGFRWAILGGNFALNWISLVLSLMVTGVLFITGLWYFRRTERTFADVI